MNILYVGSFELPDKSAAAVRVMGNACALRSEGHNVVLSDMVRSQRGCEKRMVNGFTVYSRKKSGGIVNYLRLQFSTKEIKRIIVLEKIDCLILYNYPSFSFTSLLVYCKMSGIKVIGDCTEWYSPSAYPFPLSFFSGIDTFFRMRVINKRASGLIVISTYLADYYKKQKIFYLPFFVDKNGFSKLDKKEFESEMINLIYAGNPGRSKESLHEIIEGVFSSANSKRIVLRITGLTREEYLFREPSDIDLVDRNSVFFFGKVSRDENLSLVSSSDFLIFYRKRTRQNMAGFPTKFVEAVSLGVPVITTDTSDLKTISEAHNIPTVFVNSGNDLSEILSQSFERLKLMKEVASKAKDTFDFHNGSHRLNEWLVREIFNQGN